MRGEQQGGSIREATPRCRLAGRTTAALVCAVATELLVSCGRQQPPAPNTARLQREPSLNSVTPQVQVLVQHPKLFVKRGGKLVWQLNAFQTQAEVTSQLAKVSDVSGAFYRQGTAAVTVKAPEATIDYQYKTLFLGKGVIVADPTQFQRFTADRVQWKWDAENGLIATGHVRFTRGALVVTGGRLDADISLKDARLSQNPVAQAPESTLHL